MARRLAPAAALVALIVVTDVRRALMIRSSSAGRPASLILHRDIGAGRADLDGVRLDGLLALEQPLELSRRPRASATRGQLGSEDIGHLDGRCPVADRAAIIGRPPDVLCCPQQLRVGIADVFSRHLPGANGARLGIADQPVLDGGLSWTGDTFGRAHPQNPSGDGPHGLRQVSSHVRYIDTI